MKSFLSNRCIGIIIFSFLLIKYLQFFFYYHIIITEVTKVKKAVICLFIYSSLWMVPYFIKLPTSRILMRHTSKSDCRDLFTLML